MSTRAYKNFKHNSNTKKKRSISPEYLEHRFKRGGGSLKTAYCDEDDDGIVASTFALKRSPAVYKGATCEVMHDPPPEVGAVGISLEVLKPEIGPVEANLEIVKPNIGPVGLGLRISKPQAGPVGMSTGVVKPDQGPVGTALSIPKIEAGPVGIVLENMKPLAGPVNINLGASKPEKGPVGINLGMQKPEEGPVGLSVNVPRPAAGPVDITPELPIIPILEDQDISPLAQAYTVEVSGDGNTIAIAGDAGTKVYTRSSPSSSWIKKGSDIPYDNGVMSMSDDGNTLIVADAWTDVGFAEDAIGGQVNSGHFIVYRWDGVNQDWAQMGDRKEGREAFARYGEAVAISGNGLVIAVGGPFASSTISHGGYFNVYEWNSETSVWDQRGSDIDGMMRHAHYGEHLDINYDGSRVLNLHPKGQVASHVNYGRIYEWDGLEYTQIGHPTGVAVVVDNGSGGATDHNRKCKITSNGEYVVITGGFYDNDRSSTQQTEVYRWDGSAWVQVGQSLDVGGAQVDLNSAGTLLFVQIFVRGPLANPDQSWTEIIAQRTQKLHIYKLQGSEWVLDQEVNAVGALALSSDNTTLVTSVYNTGLVRSYSVTSPS